MNTAIEIPTLSFSTENYNNETKEILINLNDFRFVDEQLNDYQQSHRRILPEINLISPTGVQANFCNPTLDGWEIVYQGIYCSVRLTYK